ncbi:MAG: 50S ribosomal protein L6 [Acidimicrobiia bacterium]
MSRIGRTPIAIPSGVEITVDGRTVKVKGPKGELSRDLPGAIEVEREGDTLVVTRPNDERQNRSLHGLTRTLVSNMVVGVTQGFTKDLEIVGVGYRAEADGPSTLRLALGFSHPHQKGEPHGPNCLVKIVRAPEGITFEVPSPTRISVKGIDKEVVGQVAANIRAVRKPEPYKGKGVRYAGEKVLRKAGKTGK